MRFTRSLLALLLLPALAFAQDPPIRRVLQGENATIVFGPQGGYAPENYLKKYTASGGPAPGDAWATQNGALAELIRRTTPGGKVRIAAFRCDDKEVMDALFEVARTKNVEVKLWLKGAPGLTYMVPAHEAIGQRANEYLRQRAAQGKQAEWGEVQVMLGTAEQMAAFGKINDMHQKFGVVDLALEHGPGRNNAFLGTSNIGSSSDRSHNESRLFFLGNPHAAQRLGQEFARLWTHLGRCLTTVDGAAGGAPNATPETPESVRIRVGNGFADETEGDPLRFRFTYERDANGQFHEISRDFIAGLEEARQLPAGAIVYIAQFGFQIHSITEALLRVARATPQVEFRVLVHMGETEAGHLQRLVDAKLPNLEASIKWDSNKLLLERGARPQVPDHDHPGPALLHHKTMVVGDRLMITGSFNFFPDADDQGEQIVIIRNHVAPTYAHVLADTRAELDALWRSAVVIDAGLVLADGGLLETVEALSGEDGFLETLNAIGATPKSRDEVEAALGAAAPADADLTRFLEALERFQFVEKDADGKYYKADPDVVAHQDKPKVRERAVEGPVTPPPPAETTLRGRLSLEGDALRLAAGGTTYAVSGLATELRPLVGREVEVFGKVDGASLAASRLVSPARGETTGVVEQVNGALFVVTGTTRREAFGPAARALSRAVGRLVVVDGHAFEGALCVLAVQGEVTRTGRLTKTGVPIGLIQKGQRVWVTGLNQSGSQATVRHQGREGQFLMTRLVIGTASSGIVNAIPETTTTPGQ